MSPTAIDDTLAREASDGDGRALGKIFDAFHQPLYRYCLAILGNRQDAEDALQETMVKVLRALPGEKRTIALKPWLYRIAHNESIDLLRRRRASVPMEEVEPFAGEGLAEQVETRQRLRQLIADVGALPERQRGALLMREAGGLGFEEIAAALGTSPAVARQTLYEARLGLRQMNAGREMDCAAVCRALSDGDRRVRRRRDVRAHLRDCAECHRFAEEVDSRRGVLGAIAPLPAVAATALLHGVFGGGGAAAVAGGSGAAGAGAGAGGVLGGTAAKSIGTATLLKGAATVAVVAAVGVGAADRGGLIDIGGQNPAPAGKPGAEPAGASASPETTPAPSASKVDSTSGPSAHSKSQGAVAARSSTETARAATPSNADAATHDSGPPSQPPGAGGESSTAPGKSGVEHPHGRGHAKQTPAAAAHGQETAASHKSEQAGGSETGSGEGSGSSKSAGASHPPHPAHPAEAAAPAEQPGPAEPEAEVEAPAETGPPAGKPEGKGPK